MLRHLLCAVSLAVVVTPAFAQAEDPGQGLSPNQKTAVDNAISIMEKMGKDEAAKKDGSVEQEAGKVGEKLREALKEGRIREDYRKGKAGRTTFSSKFSGSKLVLISDAVLPLREAPVAMPPCHPDFPKLLETLFHEGFHVAHHDLTNPDDLFDPLKTLDAKLKAIQDELEAFNAEAAFKRKIDLVLGKILNNKNPNNVPESTPAWAEDWVGCSVSLLDAMKKNIAKELAGVNDWISFLSGFANAKGNVKSPGDLLDKKPGDTVTDDEKKDLVKKLDENEKLVEVTGVKGIPPSQKNIVIQGASDNPIFTVDGKPLDTGIPHPQDAVFFADTQARSWILFAGNTGDQTGPVLRALRLEFEDDGFTVAETRVLADPFSRLGYVTSLARTDGGRFYAMDVRGPGVYRIEDSDADGVPDTIGSLAIPAESATLLVEFAELTSTGNSLLAEMRPIRPFNGNPPLVTLKDADQDGHFETVQKFHVSEVGTIPPRWPVAPTAGATSLLVAGPHGHLLVVLSGGENGQPIGQAQVPQFPTGEVLVTLSRPLQQGESLAIRNATNGVVSAIRQVEEHRPVVYGIVGEPVQPGTESTLTLSGTGFEAVQGVRIDGKKADILAQSATSLTIRTPKLHRELRWKLEFELPGKNLLEANVEIEPTLYDP
ncbi:MAG: hypothetical protein HYY18_06560 [Planctomycetes bacterium]|nr:hypothetical protein [Planctomycetota bacterium]